MVDSIGQSFSFSWLQTIFLLFDLGAGVFRLDARHPIAENGRNENQSGQAETGQEETQVRHSLGDLTKREEKKKKKKSTETWKNKERK